MCEIAGSVAGVWIAAALTLFVVALVQLRLDHHRRRKELDAAILTLKQKRDLDGFLTRAAEEYNDGG